MTTAYDSREKSWMNEDWLHYHSSPSAFTQNKPIKLPFFPMATPRPSRSSDNLRRHTQPVTRGKVRLTAAHGHWFNDLSAAGEWSHSNILLWLVLRAPLRVWLTWFWLARVPLTRQPAHHIDKIRAAALMPDMTQRRTCGVKLDEAEELFIEAAREGMSQPMHFWWNAGQRGGRGH